MEYKEIMKIKEKDEERTKESIIKKGGGLKE